ncbi:hypothetical protein EIP86_008664 [Pleurotus ostreatoroseus]|nr:hypothetical protein EIP86_008664 [Pleurotus ostreatoroseus]
MAHLAIVNAPASFTAIWAVMRPWLAKETVAKVSVLGADYRAALLGLVDAENLPTSLGGTCTCEDCGPDAQSAGSDDKGKGGVDEMGRCAYSSAGPWMVGRAERRAAWLRGERKTIGLQPGELEAFASASASRAAPSSAGEVSAAGTGIPLDAVEEDADADEGEGEGDGEGEGEGDSSQSSSPGPGTPPADADARGRQLGGAISVREDSKSVGSKHVSRDVEGLVPGAGAEGEGKQPAVVGAFGEGEAEAVTA